MWGMEGARVIEVGNGVAVPFCGRLLADLGAEVVKVEPPHGGDDTRRWGPASPRAEMSPMFAYLNASKSSVTVDLTVPKGRDLLAGLLSTADVVCMDLPPATAVEWGFDFAALHETHGRLVVVTVTPFGFSGPYRDFAAYDLTVFHGGGEGYVLGAGLNHDLLPDRPPVTAGTSLAGYQTGLTAATGAVAALVALGEGADGQHVDVSAQEAQLSLNHLTAMRFVDGVLETRDNRRFTFGGVVACRDGHVEVLPLEQHQWELLVRLMDSPAWAAEDRFATGADRAANGPEINSRIAEWAADRTRAEISERGQQLGLPVAPYHGIGEVLTEARSRWRDFFVDVEYPGKGPLPQPRLPFRTGADPVPRRPAPLLGEHTEQVLGELLGLSDHDLSLLRANSII